MKSLQDKITELSPERRAKIEVQSEALYQEYLSLQELRKALNITQKDVADTLHIEQNNVSRLERRKDMRLSTLKEFIEALGCELSLIVSIPGKGRVAISNFFDETNPNPEIVPLHEIGLEP
jgi:transcriptional regulator with XRE-family HTH domain